METSLTTPALLFPAISLLLLAYTSRFLALAALIRQLHRDYNQSDNQSAILGQIKNLRTRVHLIRAMQLFGVISFFFCVLSMIFIHQSMGEFGGYVFGLSLVLLLISLLISTIEVQLSTHALEIALSDMEPDSGT